MLYFSVGFIIQPKKSAHFKFLSPLQGISPNKDESMEEYRKAIMQELEKGKSEYSSTKLGGRELLELIIRKWGVAYDIQLLKSSPFGEGSSNVYVNSKSYLLSFRNSMFSFLLLIDSYVALFWAKVIPSQ